MTHRPFCRPWSPGGILKRMDRMAAILAMAEDRRRPGILLLPLQSLPQLSLPDAAKRMLFSNAALSFTKYACFPAF